MSRTAADMLRSNNRATARASLAVLAVVPVVLFLFSVAMGQYWIPVEQILQVLVGNIVGAQPTWPDTLETVLYNVRIPRILCALMIGAALACSGATYQGVFKNPMVSPDILGASAGAGFGAAFAILCSFNTYGIVACAFAFGLAAVFLAVSISNLISKGANVVLLLVLTGMVIQALFSAFTSITKYVADPESKLPEITYWLMGGLNSCTKQQVVMMFVPFVIGLVPMFLNRWHINVLSFGEEEARSLGINTKRVRFVLIVSATLLTAASVSIAGMVGWVGLVIPHLARLVVGPNYQVLLPASLLMGMSFMLVVDDVSRLVFAAEIPLSILTAIIGAPFFLYLLVKGKAGWNSE